MSFPHRFALVFASASLGLLGCASGGSPADGGADAGVTDLGATDAGATDLGGPDVPVVPQDVPTDAGGATVLTAALTGRQVVPTAYASTASGTVTFTLSPDRSLLSYTITHTILLPTSTRLYLGLAGGAGTMLLALTNNGGTTIGTTGLTPDQAQAILEGRTYVSIASSAFPDGELRGQVVQPGEVVYTARLSADLDGRGNAGAPGGVAEILVDAAASRLRFAVHTAGLVTVPMQAHIHTGSAGNDGPVVIDLAPVGVPFAADFLGTRTLTPANLADLESGRLYVNVHTMGDREIRGQILRPGERLYFARLSGSEEVPPVTTPAGATLGLIVSAERDRVTYLGEVTGLMPTAAHLHAGAPGAVGDVVTPLVLMGNFLRGSAALTATGDAGVPLLTGLAAGTIYANVHTAMYPMGEIRGQVRVVPAPSSP